MTRDTASTSLASPPERRSEPDGGFDPERHRAELCAIIRAVEAIPDQGGVIPAATLDGILRLHPREGRGFFSRAELIAGYRQLAGGVGASQDEQRFVRRVQLRPVRTQSGVTPLTVLTRPHPCPGRCVFCPNDVRMPKSYLSDEPGAQRAAINRFDPYLQTWNRLAAFRAIGHPVDKVELIVLGGTWSSHPEPYQIWFVKRCFDALDDFGCGIDGRSDARPRLRDLRDARSSAGASYNDTVSGFLRADFDGRLAAPDESASWQALERAQRRNESSACRSVGLVIETRPDHVTPDEVRRIRRLGCTKVQIGFQSLSDAVLRANQRGHDVAATRRAMLLLRGAGFKIHAHWMPNLLGSSPELDVVDFQRIFDDADFRPDELKIYPCSLIATAELMQHYERGAWQPYSHDELLDVVSSALAFVPRYCRVTRVVRDISSDDIVTGNKRTNFRQLAELELARLGRRSQDIRAREIRDQAFDPDGLELRASAYESSIGRESFLELVTAEDRIVAFLRLSLPERAACIREIDGSALLREVHVYGAPLALGARSDEQAQHRGFGRRLIEEAVWRSRAAGYDDLAVISAVGTRPYYRRLGFVDGELYQHRDLSAEPPM